MRIEKGDIITFTEYEPSSFTGRLRIKRRLENMTVYARISPGQVLTAGELEEYYGEDITEEQRHALCTMGATRLIVADDDERLYSVTLSEDFLKTGLQKIEQVQAPPAPEQINYLAFMNSYGGMQ